MGFEPDLPDFVSSSLPGVDFHLSTRERPVSVLRTNRCALHADRKNAPAATKQSPQAVNGGQPVPGNAAQSLLPTVDGVVPFYILPEPRRFSLTATLLF